ncbi:MAG TPA: hypothetical protein VGM98_14395 [Schlesneria sp.]
MNDVLATYNEVRVDGRRYFELYSDRIRVKGKAVRADFDATVYLADLRPDPNRVWIRHGYCVLGIIMLLLSLVSFALMARSLSDQDYVTTCASTGLALGFVGSVIGFKTFSKVEFSQFQSHGGIVILNVSKAGPDRLKFDDFVGLLAAQIRAAQKPT